MKNNRLSKSPLSTYVNFLPLFVCFGGCFSPSSSGPSPEEKLQPPAAAHPNSPNAGPSPTPVSSPTSPETPSQKQKVEDFQGIQTLQLPLPVLSGAPSSFLPAQSKNKPSETVVAQVTESCNIVKTLAQATQAEETLTGKLLQEISPLFQETALLRVQVKEAFLKSVRETMDPPFPSDWVKNLQQNTRDAHLRFKNRLADFLKPSLEALSLLPKGKDDGGFDHVKVKRLVDALTGLSSVSPNSLDSLLSQSILDTLVTTLIQKHLGSPPLSDSAFQQAIDQALLSVRKNRAWQIPLVYSDTSASSQQIFAEVGQKIPKEKINLFWNHETSSHYQTLSTLQVLSKLRDQEALSQEVYELEVGQVTQQLKETSKDYILTTDEHGSNNEATVNTNMNSIRKNLQDLDQAIQQNSHEQ